MCLMHHVPATGISNLCISRNVCARARTHTHTHTYTYTHIAHTHIHTHTRTHTHTQTHTHTHTHRRGYIFPRYGKRCFGFSRTRAAYNSLRTSSPSLSQGRTLFLFVFRPVFVLERKRNGGMSEPGRRNDRDPKGGREGGAERETGDPKPAMKRSWRSWEEQGEGKTTVPIVGSTLRLKRRPLQSLCSLVLQLSGTRNWEK